MKVNVNARSITHKRPKESNQETKRIELRPSHTLSLDLTYSLPLPLGCQAPKLKGQTMGQEQLSRALRCGERSKTELHHPLALNSERSDPLSLEVKVKMSGSA